MATRRGAIGEDDRLNIARERNLPHKRVRNQDPDPIASHSSNPCKETVSECASGNPYPDFGRAPAHDAANGFSADADRARSLRGSKIRSYDANGIGYGKRAWNNRTDDGRRRRLNSFVVARRQESDCKPHSEDETED